MKAARHRLVLRTFAVVVVLCMMGSPFASVAGADLPEEPEPDTSVEGFIEKWMPLLDNHEFVADYVNGEYDVDETFSHLTEEERDEYALALVHAYDDHSQTFHDLLRENLTSDAELEERIAQAALILRQMIFTPAELLEAMTAGGMEDPAEPAPVEDEPESNYFPGLSQDEIREVYRDQIEADAAYPTQDDFLSEVDLGTDPQVLEAIQPQEPLADNETVAEFDRVDPEEIAIEDLEPVIAPGADEPETVAVEVASLEGLLTEAGLGDMPVPEPFTVEVPLGVMPVEVPSAPDPSEVIPDLPLPVTADDALALVDQVVDEVTALALLAATTLTYDICWQHVSATEPTCALLPGLLGSPSPIDLDGDGVTDVIVTLTAGAALESTSAGVTLDVRRADLSTDALQYLIYGRIAVPGEANLHGLLGFDGRTETLSTAATLRATVSDLAGDLGAHLSLATDGAGNAMGMIGGLVKSRASADGVEFYDPLLASLEFSPVPPLYEVDVEPRTESRLIDGAATQATLVDLGMETSLPTRLSFGLLDQEGDRADILSVVVDQLPLTTEIAVETVGDDVTMAYEASAAIDAVSFTSIQVPDINDPTTFKLATDVLLETVPTTIDLEATAGSVSYRAADVMSKVEYLSADVVSGEALKLTYAQALDIPVELDLVSDEASIDFRASDPLGTVTFLTFEGRGAPIGLAGDHFATLAQTIGGESFSSTSAQLTGLQAFHADLAGDLVATVETVHAGGFAAVVVQETDTTSSIVYGEVSDLPDVITIALRDDGFRYDASAAIDEVLFAMLEDGPGSSSQVAALIEGLPARIDVAFDLAAGSIHYDASSIIDRILVSSQTQSGGATEQFLVQILDLPASLRVGWNLATSTFAYETDTRLGDIAALARRTVGGAIESDVYFHVNDLPSTIMASWADGAVDLVTGDAIGLVELAAGQGTAAGLLPASEGDHALVYQFGATSGLSARITGLAGAHADVGQGAFSIELSHTRPFLVAALSDSETMVARILDLPERIEVALGDDDVMFHASQRIDRLELSRVSGSTSMVVLVEDLSDEVFVNFGDTPYMNAAGGIGTIAFSQAKNTAPAFPPTDGFYLIESGSAQLLAARLSGLTSFRAVTDGSHLELDTRADQPFVAYISKPGQTALVSLSNMPGKIRVDMDAATNTFAYKADGPVRSIEVYLDQTGQTVYARVAPIPGLMTATWDGDSIQFHASEVIRDITVVLAKSPTEYAQLIIEDLPRTLSVTVRSDYIHYAASSEVTRITGIVVRGNLGIGVTLEGIPRTFTLQMPGTNTMRFDAPGGINRVAFYYKDAPGGFRSLGGDHAYFERDRTGEWASFQITGLETVAYLGNAVELRLSNPTVFTVYVRDATGSEETSLFAQINKLPAYVRITWGDRLVSYTASSTISSITLAARKGHRSISAVATGVPSSFTITYGDGSTVFSYSASGTMGSIAALAEDGNKAIYAAVTGIPSRITVTKGTNSMALSTSGTIGNIRLHYKDAPGGFAYYGADHALYWAHSGATYASFGLSGLKAASYRSLSSSTHSFSISRSGSSPFYMDLQDRTNSNGKIIWGQILNLPASMSINLGDGSFSYSASSVISSIDVAVSEANNAGRNYYFGLRSVPSSISMSWADNDFYYSANSRLGALILSTQAGNERMYASVSGVPRSMSLTTGGAVQLITGPSYEPGIGSIVFRMAEAPGSGYQALGGDHMLYIHDKISGSRTDRWVSFQISNVRKAEWFDGSSSGDHYINLQAGNGGHFSVYVYDDTQPRFLRASGYFTLTDIAIRLGGYISITTSRNMDFYMDVETGTLYDLARTPNVPYTTHGVVARQYGGATKARIFLTGLPTSVNIDPDAPNFQWSNFNPRYSYILLDYEKPQSKLDAWALLYNPPRYINSLTMTKSASWMNVAYSGWSFGPFYAYIQKGSDFQGYMAISNFPSSMSFTYDPDPNGRTDITWSASSSIRSIYAQVAAVSGGARGYAYASMTDIPKWFNLAAYRSDRGPTLNYDASGSNRDSLDISFYVTADFQKGSADLSARVYFSMTNLGRYTDMWTGTTGGKPYVGMSSYPDTDRIYLEVWARYADSGGYYKRWYDDICAIRWCWDYYEVKVDVDWYVNAWINQLYFYTEDLETAYVKIELPGLKFFGFDTHRMAMGWGSIGFRATLDFEFKVRLLVWTLIHFDNRFSFNHNIWADFHVYSANWWRIIHTCGGFWPIGTYCMYFDVYPQHRASYRNGFSVYRSWGSTQWVGIDPYGWVPNWLMHAYMFASKGGFSWGIYRR